jgi:hypothetical protein
VITLAALITNKKLPVSTGLKQGWRNYGTRKAFLSTRHSPMSPFFYFFCSRPASVNWENMCIHIHTSDTYRLRVNCRCYQITPQWNIFTQIRSGAKCRLHIITRVPAWRWPGGYVTVGKSLYSLLFKHEVVSAPVTAIFPSLLHSSRRPLLEI